MNDGGFQRRGMVRMIEEEEDDGILLSPSLSSQLNPLMMSKREAQPVGRALNTLLSSPLRQLQQALSLSLTQKDPLSRALTSLLHHIELAEHSLTGLEHVIVPLLEHVTKSKGKSNRKQVISLVHWLLERKEVGWIVVQGLVEIIKKKQFDHRVQLGWCIVVLELLQNKLMWQKNGIAKDFLFPFLRCVPDLTMLVSEPSPTLQMPTRLSLAAANCILMLTKILSQMSSTEDAQCKPELESVVVRPAGNLYSYQPNSDETNLEPSTSGQKDIQMEMILWDQLDHLLTLVAKLQEWNENCRPLHAQGLQQVGRRLQNLANYRNSVQSRRGGNSDALLGAAVLAASWQHYSSLMLTENPSLSVDHKALISDWLDGLQGIHFEGSHGEEIDAPHDHSRQADEIRAFFLICLTLLIGRLEASQFETVICDFGSKIVHVLIGQLRGGDDLVADLAVAVLRRILSESDANTPKALKLESIISSLLDFLDERDIAAKAVVVLIADYLAVNPGAPELQRLFTILDSGKSAQRWNALSVLSKLLQMLSSSEDTKYSGLRQSVATHLLDRLGDDELTNRIEASSLFAKLDPMFVIPTLIQRVYSRDDKVRSAASSALLAVLKGQNDQESTVLVLLNCVSNMAQRPDVPKHPGQIGRADAVKSVDVDRIMRVIPEWSSQVQCWDSLIPVLLNKMLSDPSNVILPRFLAYISEHLLNNASIVFGRVLEQMCLQPRITKEMVAEDNGGDSNISNVGVGNLLFERLSPLLILKILPLQAFDDNGCKELYDEGMDTKMDQPFESRSKCIMLLLMERAYATPEFEDVRKLASELIGRLLPNVMLPLVVAEFESAVEIMDMLKIRACLFTICTTLWVRKEVSNFHPSMKSIRALLSEILLWPCSSDDKETAKTQHGCIDCFAMMVVAELSSSASNKVCAESKLISSNIHDCENHLLSSIILCLTGKTDSIPFLPHHKEAALRTESSKIPAPFRVCLANVLISVNQKISAKERQSFVTQIMPPIFKYLQASSESKIKAACLQIMFSSVYNLKEAIIPFAVDLLNVSIRCLLSKGSVEVLPFPLQGFEGLETPDQVTELEAGLLNSRGLATLLQASDENDEWSLMMDLLCMPLASGDSERLAAGKVLASLLASDTSIISEISHYLEDAKMALVRVSSIDSSPQVRSLCEQLLKCLTVPEY